MEPITTISKYSSYATLSILLTTTLGRMLNHDSLFIVTFHTSLSAVPTEEVITFLEWFTKHYRSDGSTDKLSSQDLHPSKRFVTKANLTPSMVSLSISSIINIFYLTL